MTSLLKRGAFALIHFNNLQTLFQNEILNKAQTLNLKAGDLVHGQILKLFPNQLVLVQIGGMKLHAKLTAPLTTNVPYLFQVVQNDSIIELKLVDDPLLKRLDSKKDQENISNVLKQVGLPETKENKQLLRLFLNEQLPFSKETLKAASSWLKEADKVDIPKALDAIRLAVQKELPINKNILYSLLALQTDETLSDHLVKVLEAVNTMNPKSPALQQLQTVLMQMTEQIPESEKIEKKLPTVIKQSEKFSHHSSAPREKFPSTTNQSVNELNVDWSNGKAIVKTLKQLVQNFGLQYEHDISILEKDQPVEVTLQSIKPLLISALEEPLSPNVNEKIEQLLQRITGQQLINSEQQGQIHQLLLQLPILLGSHLTDLSIQWTGKKQENGQIDPDYCRILFFLELEQLQETLVDVLVQNRIVNIQIYNDTPQLEVIVKEYQMIIKEQLDHLQYRLSGINVSDLNNGATDKKHNVTNNIMPKFPLSTTGVDIKI